jgi:hypothetical protein
MAKACVGASACAVGCGGRCTVKIKGAGGGTMVVDGRLRPFVSCVEADDGLVDSRCSWWRDQFRKVTVRQKNSSASNRLPTKVKYRARGIDHHDCLLSPELPAQREFPTQREDSAIVPCLSRRAGGYQEKAAIDR